MIRHEQVIKKHEIIAEYLGGEESYKALGKKYGVNARTIQTWVRAYRKSNDLPTTVEAPSLKEMKKRLAEAELKNELLEEMLRLSSEQMGVDLRKKFGSRQS